MTSITSLFNKGIYKNTLRRFKWGSFLYFIILFLAVPFTILTRTPDYYQMRYNANSIEYADIFFSYSNFIPTMLLAFVVPTVTALLLYNYVHSSKHGIFAHSLPATRCANYVSSLAAGLTLMLLPLVANGIILYAMKFFGYSDFISFSNVFHWFCVNAFIIFVMFSVATFSSFLTGNSFAQITINVLIHAFLPIVALIMIMISDTFLYGCDTNMLYLPELLVEYTPVVWIGDECTSLATKLFSNIFTYIYILVAIVFYVLSYLLYKKRKIESCGEVAGFKIMKPILKYTVTAFVALGAFGIFINTTIPFLSVVLVTVITSLIAYFACEMILNKTLKVFHSYRGYAGFALCFSIIMCFCAFTSVFGYETRVPKIDQIDSVLVREGYEQNSPITSDDEAKQAVIDFHKEIIKDTPVLSNWSRTESRNNNSGITFKYKLKNGRSISRQYRISAEMCSKIISKMFDFNEYKRGYSGIDRLNIDNIKNMELTAQTRGYSYSFALNEDARELLHAVEKDLESITYGEYHHDSPIQYRISLDISAEDNKIQKIFKVIDDSEMYYMNFDFQINSYFKNAYKYLEEKGYIKISEDRFVQNMYIGKKQIKTEIDEKYGEVYYRDENAIQIKEQLFTPGEYSKIDIQDANEVLNYVKENEEIIYNRDGYHYYVFVNENPGHLYGNSSFAKFTPEELPDYLRKYVE